MKRYGNENQHNAPIPRWFWLEDDEKEAVLAYYANHPEEGYRRLSYMMLDEGYCRRKPKQRLPGAHRGWEAEKMGQKALREGERSKSPSTLAY